MAIKLNLNQEVKEAPQQIKAGEYEVTATNFDTKVVGDKNVISFEYEIRDDVEQEFQGRKIFQDDFFCTEKALWKIENASIAAGFTEEESEFEKYTEWAKAFLNKKLRLVVKYEEANNGKEYLRVKYYNKSRVAPPAPVDIDESELPF
ncbi:DUF669 domain-containing protein [Planomicrobium okeanokoites]|uniref:DUF669 domain-containing protein n=1 Tax=Planomicrobium okeanokoites TaxID=244 RepID=A0ABV7KTB4_PLAOK|nr:DUF669 domain-containing protein [Planomicrobium okeanokoites]TAA67451.1 DUF669 domain-containing protein [Planomicrobium okeanokoites]